ncbi:MAG: DUF2070 family protein [Candidatus Micrarchaeota archaeon]
MNQKGEGSENIKSAVNLTNYLFSLPSITVIFLAMVLVALLFGAALNFPPKADFIISSIFDGLFLLLAPAIVTAIVVKVFIRKIPLKRILATAAAGELIYGLAYLFSSFIFNINPFYGQMAIFVGAAFVFVIWYLVARLVFILRYRSLLFAVLQLCFYLVFLFNTQYAMFLGTDSTMALAAKAYISSFILLGAIFLIFYLINAPMKKTFGVSSTDVFTLFISQWIYKKNDLEKAFEKIGENAKTLIGVIGFKRKSGTVLFLVPCVHFGPFGSLGGSEFSNLIAEAVDKKFGVTSFVFHGTVTHDLNPTSASEISKVVAAVDVVLKRAKYSVKTAAFAVGRSAECTAEALHFGDSTFIGVSRAPKLTEDINFGLGLSMMLAAEKKVANAIIADQHNAELGEVTSFEPGSVIGYNYLKAVEAAVAKVPKGEKLQIGIARRQPQSSAVGRAGIKVAVVSSSPTYVIVLIDSNGVTPEFKEVIEKSVGAQHKCRVGVFTTDTHETNVVRGVLNPVREEQEILDQIVAAANEAFEDMEDATAFVDKEWFDIRVIGAKHSIEIVSTVNSVVAVAKIAVPLILIGGVLAILAIMSKVPLS